MREPGFADHFSGIASSYARYRPDYPRALGAWLAERAGARRRAWDCATGNGQVAVMLADHFDQVVASDASGDQLAAATPHPSVAYVCATAERAPFAGASFDLITVGQALHWFDRPAFYAQVAHALAPGGFVAVWCYGLLSVEPSLDRLLRELYSGILGSYWPAGRKLVERGYADVEFPFEEIEAPRFAMAATWSLANLLGYIATWSAATLYRQRTGRDAIDLVRDRITRAWGDASTERLVRWPLSVRAGYHAARR